MSYFISHKDGVLVVSLQGELSADAATPLAECQKATILKAPKMVILHMGEVPKIHDDCHREFIQFQKAIRDSGAILRLTGIESKVWQPLSIKGIVRTEEIRETLQDALKEAASRFGNS